MVGHDITYTPPGRRYPYRALGLGVLLGAAGTLLVFVGLAKFLV